MNVKIKNRLQDPGIFIAGSKRAHGPFQRFGWKKIRSFIFTKKMKPQAVQKRHAHSVMLMGHLRSLVPN